MPVGRASEPRRRGERDETPAPRRSERARRDSARAKRPVRQGPARPRPKSGSTGGAFKLSSTRRAAGLAMLVCVMALSVSVPLRTYLSQRAELAEQARQQDELSRQVRELEMRKQELSDPAQVEAEARARLGYVRPGETPYIVQVPEQPAAPPPAAAPVGEDLPWYEDLWKSVMGGK